MELDQARKFIQKHLDGHMITRSRQEFGWRYYRCENDIKRSSRIDGLKAALPKQDDPLRNADFRIAHNWHQLLVNQKVAYLFTWAPAFDTGKTDLNARISAVLGGEFPKKVQDLAVSASNAGMAWLHCWREDTGAFRYAPVPSTEIIPVFSRDLEREVEAVLRVYTTQDDDAKTITKYEIWTATEVEFYEQKGETSAIMPEYIPGAATNLVRHDMGYVPFVPFRNNSLGESDLFMVKDLIDQYDLVVSGFANDLTDIQEVIFVLRNYGGEDLNTFLSELKRYKAIKVEGDAASGGVETMKIDIPVEARVRFLELLKRQIFISGQGVDPDPANFGNSSGVALKYLYSLLEIKAGLLETEFRASFAQLLKLILHYLHEQEDMTITQVYTRNAIQNDQETAGIAAQSVGIISDKTILQNHPWVEDAEAEEKQLDKEEDAKADKYGLTVGVPPGKGDPDGGE